MRSRFVSILKAAKGGAMIVLGLVIFVVAIVVVFSVQNATPVAVSFLSWHFEASLAIIILLAVLAGLILGMIVLSSMRLLRSSRKKRKEKEAQTGQAPKNQALS